MSDALRAEKLCKCFGEREILKEVSIRVEAKETVAILGVSGVGKTTLFHILSGLYSPDSGRVFCNGEDCTGRSGMVRYMLQSDSLLPFRKMLDNVTLPLQLAGVRREQAYAKARLYWKEFGLEGYEDAYPAQLSGGMRQRAALLRTYLDAKGVVLLDEPFSALDTITKGRMHRWFIEVVEKRKLSTLLITHDVDEAIFLADRVYILGGEHGEILAQFSHCKPRDIEGDFMLTDAYLAYKRKIIRSLQSELERIPL